MEAQVQAQIVQVTRAALVPARALLLLVVPGHPAGHLAVTPDRQRKKKLRKPTPRKIYLENLEQNHQV